MDTVKSATYIASVGKTITVSATTGAITYA
jgi:hypothetical protein